MGVRASLSFNCSKHVLGGTCFGCLFVLPVCGPTSGFHCLTLNGNLVIPFIRSSILGFILIACQLALVLINVVKGPCTTDVCHLALAPRPGICCPSFQLTFQKQNTRQRENCPETTASTTHMREWQIKIEREVELDKPRWQQTWGERDEGWHRQVRAADTPTIQKLPHSGNCEPAPLNRRDQAVETSWMGRPGALSLSLFLCFFLPLYIYVYIYVFVFFFSLSLSLYSSLSLSLSLSLLPCGRNLQLCSWRIHVCATHSGEATLK